MNTLNRVLAPVPAATREKIKSEASLVHNGMVRA
jgi:hypothetical protein